MKRRWIQAGVIGLLAVVVAATVRAQGRPSVAVTVRVGSVVTAGNATNAAPTSCTTNLTSSGLFRVGLLIQNTNTAGNVVLYTKSSTNYAVEAVIGPNGGSYAKDFPEIDNGEFAVRSAGAAVPVIVSERWGQQ